MAVARPRYAQRLRSLTQDLANAGGGTGGHITPILAVAEELKTQSPTCETVYVGEWGGKFGELTDNHPAIDATYRVFSGKYRRYHGESFLKRLFDVPTNLLNIRDYVFGRHWLGASMVFVGSKSNQTSFF